MLSRSASHAIRALAYISAQEATKWVMNRKIAEELELPPMFLTKLLRALAASGVLESSRGRTGGFRLSRSARKITLLEIVEPFDSLLNRKECVLGQAVCSNSRPCPLHEEWIRISRHMAETLRKMTLDVAADPSLWRGSFPRGHLRAPGRPRSRPSASADRAASPPTASRKIR